MKNKLNMKKRVALAVMTASLAVTMVGAPLAYASEGDVALEDAITAAALENDADVATEEENAVVEESAQEGELTEEDVEGFVAKIDEAGNSYKQGDKVPEDDVITAVDAVYQLALELKNQGVVTKVNKRTSNVEVTFTNGQVYTWEAGNEPSETALEEQKEKEGKILQPVSEAPIQSTEEQTRWEPLDSENKTQQFLTPVPSTTTRYEIFYTAGTEIPTVKFTSATGKYNLVAGQDVVTDGEKAFKFITRTNMTIDGHDDFRFMTIYIDNTDDPGKWLMEVTAPSSVVEVVAVASAVPDDWESVNSDSVTKPYGIIFWYVDSKRSQYRDTPVSIINELISAKASSAAVDNIQKTDPEEPDYSKAYALVTILIILAVIGVSVLLLMKANKKKTAAYRAKREAIVKKENAKVMKKKSKENDELDDFLDDFSDEYIDDSDMSGYLNVDDTENDDDIFTEDDGIYTSEDDSAEYEASVRAKEKMNDEAVSAPWMETEPIKPSNIKAVKNEPNFAVQKTESVDEINNNEKNAVQNFAETETPSFVPVKEKVPREKAPVPAPVEVKAPVTNNEPAPAWLAGSSDEDDGLFF